MRNNSKVKIQKSKLMTVMIMLLLMPVILRAAYDYPAPREKYMNDFAGIMAETDKSTMSETLRAFEQRTGVTLALVTIRSTSEYGDEDPGIEAFSAGIFRSWGLEAGGKGILMIVSTGDRKIKIETGESFGAGYEEKMLGLMEKSMVPFFKQGDYSRGIYEGMRGIIKNTEKKPFDRESGQITVIAAALVLVAAIFILARKKNRQGSSRPADKIYVKKPVMPGAPVKTKKSRQEPAVFGGGASGDW